MSRKNKRVIAISLAILVLVSIVMPWWAYNKGWNDGVSSKTYIGTDPTTLERVISRELNATDSYDIVFRHKRESLNVISFTITGKATPRHMDFSNID